MHVFVQKLLEVNSLLMALGVGTIAGIFKMTLNSIKKIREEEFRERQQERTQVHDRLSYLEQASIALLHDKIYYLCTSFLDAGWISVDDLENLEYIWRGYKVLGGNGTGEILYNKVLALPNIKPKGGNSIEKNEQ